MTLGALCRAVSEAVERQVEQVTTQPTAVLETNHIVVLNWNSSAPRLLKELSLGIRDTGSFRLNNTIVVRTSPPELHSPFAAGPRLRGRDAALLGLTMASFPCLGAGRCKAEGDE